MDVLSLMSRTRNARLPVTDGERLVGVVTLRDLMSFLAVKLDLEEAGEVNLRQLGVPRETAAGRRTW